MENGDRIKLHEDVASLKTAMEYVKAQVSNHLPTQIEDLNKRFNGLERRMAYWSGAIAVVIIVANFAVDHFI